MKNYEKWFINEVLMTLSEREIRGVGVLIIVSEGLRKKPSRLEVFEPQANTCLLEVIA